MTDAAIRYVDAHKDEPFLLFVSFLEPHHQNHTDDYPAPTGYREAMAATLWTPPDLAALGGSTAWQLPGYYGMVKRLDEAFGRLLDALKRLDLDRRHHRPLHLRPRLPLQDPQRRVQALLPRERHPRADDDHRARLRRRRPGPRALLDAPTSRRR